MLDDDTPRQFGGADKIAFARRYLGSKSASSGERSGIAANPVRPFFGSATGLVVEPVNAELERQGSSLRAGLAQYRQWYRADVSAGGRRCMISRDPWTVTFADAKAAERRETFETIAAAVTAIVGWLEPATSA